MKEFKFEISKVSGGKNIGISKSEFVTKTQFLYEQLGLETKFSLYKIQLKT